MNNQALAISAALILASSAGAQSEEVYSVAQPGGLIAPSWGAGLSMIADMNGDGLSDFVVRNPAFGVTVVGTVHSGADGSLLSTLTVPYEQLFGGGTISDVADVTGDGVRDLVHCASPSFSTSFTGRITVFSGADGSVFHQYPAPAGMRLGGSTQTFQDLTGDGIEEVIINAWTTTHAWVVLDPTNGQQVYRVENMPQQSGFGAGLAILDDHNGDGVLEFAHPILIGGQTHMVVRSGANGAQLATMQLAGATMISGNGEPFKTVSDLDGDGFRDIATGAVFGGLVSVNSSVTGAQLVAWDCATSPVPCMGSRIIEVGDWNFDGTPELMTVNNDSFSGAPVHRIVLDPRSGAVLADETSAVLAGLYSDTTRLAVAPGIDAGGLIHFFEVQGNVVLHRFAPGVGHDICDGDGTIKLRAVGSPVLGIEPTALELNGLAPGAAAVLLMAGAGDRSMSGPLGTCLASTAGRIGSVVAGPDGTASMGIHHGHAITMVGRTWFAQAVARDAQSGLVQRSNAIEMRMR
ncbi:MAG: hypothetical protein R3F17_00110 [Planctomycetota bacterium]